MSDSSAGERDEVTIRRRLENLPTAHRRVFVASCCERAAPAFIEFAVCCDLLTARFGAYSNAGGKPWD